MLFLRFYAIVVYWNNNDSDCACTIVRKNVGIVRRMQHCKKLQSEEMLPLYTE